MLRVPQHHPGHKQRGRGCCAISERPGTPSGTQTACPTPSPSKKIPVTPLFPLLTRNSPVSPFFPLLTQKQGGRGIVLCLPFALSLAKSKYSRTSTKCARKSNYSRTSAKTGGGWGYMLTTSSSEIVGAPTISFRERTTAIRQNADSDSAFTFNCRLWFRLRSWFPAGNAILQNGVDHADPRPQLGPLYQPLPPVARRHGIPQHLAHGLACDPKLLRHRTLALTFHQHGPPNTSIDLHGVHPSGVPRTWLSPQPFVKPRSGGLLFLRRITRSHGVTRSIFAPAFTFAHKQKHFPAAKSRNVLKKTSSYSELRKVG